LGRADPGAGTAMLDGMEISTSPFPQPRGLPASPAVRSSRLPRRRPLPSADFPRVLHRFFTGFPP